VRKVRLPRAAVAAAIAALSFSCERRAPAPPASAGPSRKPNVLVATIESLRADHVRWLGYPRATTPALDALARESLDFPRAYSVTSWTLTSHATLFTGLYPGAHRVLEPRDSLPPSAVTFARLLRDRGWQTAGIVSGPYLCKPYGLGLGFDAWDDSIAPDADHLDREPTDPKMEAAVRRFLDAGRDPARPFLLFLYFWDPHYAYLPPPPYDTMFVPPGAEKVDVTDYEQNTKVNATMPRPQLDYVVSQYDGEIRATDETLGRIFAMLRERGLWDDTALVITADHGEEFFDHGQKGHKNNLYVESLHVPLLVKPAKGTLATGPRSDGRIVNGVDVFPTVLELAGVDYDGPQHGRSLLGADDPARPTFHELVTTWYFAPPGSERFTKRSDRWSAIRSGDRILFDIDFHDGRKERRLYDLAADPREQKKLDDAASAAALTGRLERFHGDAARLAESLAAPAQADLTREQEQRLRAMGYLKDK
jgi:arylsulfatase A-like enzyme